jgi:hypothetical protein
MSPWRSSGTTLGSPKLCDRTIVLQATVMEPAAGSPGPAPDQPGARSRSSWPNGVLEQALRSSIISDGNWANFADGTGSHDAAIAYDTRFTHPAKHRLVRLHDRLVGRVPGAPPAARPDTLF